MLIVCDQKAENKSSNPLEPIEQVEKESLEAQAKKTRRKWIQNLPLEGRRQFMPLRLAPRFSIKTSLGFNTFGMLQLTTN